MSLATKEGKIRVCIVGCGEFARPHAERIKRQPDVELYFASRSLAKAKSYAAEYRAIGAFGSYDQAAASPDVDALIFCTPHYLHRENLELAAAHGKAALVEKPVATTVQDAQSMIDLAREAQIPFMVGENYRYMPVVLVAANLVRQGAIGRLTSVHIQAAKYQRSTGWRLSRFKMGGGALIDAGIHKLSVIRLLLGEPNVVSAVPHLKLFPEMEGEEGVSLWATCEGGAVGTLNYTWNAQSDRGAQTLVGVGEHGTMRLDFYGTEVEVATSGGVRAVPAKGDLTGIEQEQAAFLDLVRSGGQTTNAEEALGDLRFVLAAYDSMEAVGEGIEID